MDILCYMVKVSNSYVNGTTFNVYEFLQYLTDMKSPHNLYIDDSQLDIDLSTRYNFKLPTKTLINITEPTILISNALKVLSYPEVYHYIKIGLISYVIIITGGNKPHLKTCIDVLGMSETYEMLKKVIMLYNPLGINTNDSCYYGYRVEYHNGIYTNYINNDSNISKCDDWLFHTSEHIYDNKLSLKELTYNSYSNVCEMIQYCTSNHIPYCIDDNKYLVPYKRFSGLLYSKLIDVIPRMPIEFVMNGNNVIIFTYNDGLTYYLDIKVNETYPIIVTNNRVKERILWCDLEKLERILK